MHRNTYTEQARKERREGGNGGKGGRREGGKGGSHTHFLTQDQWRHLSWSGHRNNRRFCARFGERLLNFMPAPILLATQQRALDCTFMKWASHLELSGKANRIVLVQSLWRCMLMPDSLCAFL